MSDQAPPQFSMWVTEHPPLPESQRRVGAYVHVRLAGRAPDSRAPHAEIVVVDRSTSMMRQPPGTPSAKIALARDAACVAIDNLRDGVRFAVLAGSHRAVHVYPVDGGLATAGSGTREEAKAAIGRIDAIGSTAISTWLEHARRTFEADPAATRHVLLLTDGKNQLERGPDLRDALHACAPVFACDPLGIGDDWDADELLRIGQALHGTARAVPDPGTLAEIFRDVVAVSQTRFAQGVQLRVEPMGFATVVGLREMAPRDIDLTGMREPATHDRAVTWDTGTWAGEETKRYHLELDVSPDLTHRFDVDRQVAVLRLGGPDGIAVPEAIAVPARWTRGPAEPERDNPVIRTLERSRELQTEKRRGYRALQDGDRAGAATRFGRARCLATEIGDEVTLTQLDWLLEPDDGGEPRLRPDIPPSRINDVYLSSFATGNRSRPATPADGRPAPADPVETVGPAAPADPADGARPVCARCSRVARSPTARFCEKCGTPFDAPGGTR